MRLAIGPPERATRSTRWQEARPRRHRTHSPFVRGQLLGRDTPPGTADPGAAFESRLHNARVDVARRCTLPPFDTPQARGPAGAILRPIFQPESRCETLMFDTWWRGL